MYLPTSEVSQTVKMKVQARSAAAYCALGLTRNCTSN
uniref:Uncharacterized protein n=1 Tax=Anguilla anguilla TaxID=7936 RepID=A0A0E9Q9B7_ANGAN